MVAKLAEEGKINLQAPLSNYAPGLRLPAGNEHRATVVEAADETADVLAALLEVDRDRHQERRRQQQPAKRDHPPVRPRP